MRTDKKRLRVLGISLEFTETPSASLVNTRRLHEELRKIVDIDLLVVPPRRPPTGQLRRVWRTFWALVSLQFLPLHRYNVVIAHFPYVAHALALTCKLRGVPLIYDIRDDAKSHVSEEIKGTVVNLLKAPVLIAEGVARRNATAVRVVSPGMEQRLEQEGCRRPIYYIQHGIALRPLPEPCLSRQLRPVEFQSLFLVGYFGHFQKWQGIKNVILAMQMWQETTDNIGLWLVGYDSQSEYFVDYAPLVKEKGISNIIIYPLEPPERVLSFMEACDVLVVPHVRSARTEVSAPTKFTEYCAAGKPVIVTDISYMGDMVRHYQCGIVVPDSSPEELAQAFRKMSKMPTAELSLMGNNARILAEENFAIEVVAQKFFSMIRDVAAGAAS